MLQCLARIMSLIREHGLERTGMPYVRHIQGKLWELRGRGKDGIGRSLYVTGSGREVVIVRSFVKKDTQDTPGGNQACVATRKGYLNHES